MASVTVGENQLQRIIRDLRDAVSELGKEHKECGEPITDDSSNLHKFSYKLEYLLQFDQKEKTTFLGQRKDYWDYFCDCLAKIKGANDGIRFVKSIPEIKTSLGKGRAFIRYSLVHQRLADTLQQCLINHKITSDWYYARSPFLKSHLTADIINHLYELNQIHFDLAARGHDLDADWPTFARRTLGSMSSSHLWRTPSRCSSINSLAQEFHPIPDLGPSSLLGDLGELGEPSPCSIAEDLRIELDQSELRQQELLLRVQELSKEASELKGVVKDLQGQLLDAQNKASSSSSVDHQTTPPPSVPEVGDHQENHRQADNNRELAARLAAAAEDNNREVSNCQQLAARLAAAEDKNMELFSKLDGALTEKDQQTASYCHSAWKIQELLDKLKATEEDRLEAKRQAEVQARQAQRLSQDLRLRESESRRSQEQLEEVKAAARQDQEGALRRLEELQGAVGRIQGALTLKEKETGNLRAQLQDLQGSLESRERQAEDLRRRLTEEREEVEKRFFTSGSQNALLQGQVHELTEELKNCERELLIQTERVRHLEEQQSLSAVVPARPGDHLIPPRPEDHQVPPRPEDHQVPPRPGDHQVPPRPRDHQVPPGGPGDHQVHTCNHSKNLEDYRSQVTSLMELNSRLLENIRRGEESAREMSQSRAAMMDQLASLRASESHLQTRVETSGLALEDRERRLLEENLSLEQKLQKVLVHSQRLEGLEQDNKELLDVQVSLQKQLCAAQEDLDAALSRTSELHGTQAELREHGGPWDVLQPTASRREEEDQEEDQEEEEEEKEKEKAVEKGAAESTEKMQNIHHQNSSMDAKETSTKLLLEAQLAQSVREVQRLQEEVLVLRGQQSVREVQRLQEEVLVLRGQLLGGAEERMKVQVQQEVSEASREDLRLLTEQLKGQVEELNRRHVDEILQSREREEALSRDRDCEAQARMGLAEEVTSCRTELSDLKRRYEAACLENSEQREALHRSNTETAELGVHLCMLTAEKEEARLRWEALSSKLQELEDEAAAEAERLSCSMEQLQQHNHELQQHNQELQQQCCELQGLQQAMQALQADLDQVQTESRSVQDSSQEEVQALRFQLSSEAMDHQERLKEVEQQLQEVRSQLEVKQEQQVVLESKVTQLETEAAQSRRQIEDQEDHILQNDRMMLQREEELDEMKANLYRSEEGRAVAEMACRELSESLRRAAQDKQSMDLKAAAEMDDLYRTKINLEERLIELIREKDVLWQKTDALEFEQKLRDEETERDVNYCLGCHSQFSWWLRRYTCRLCGRPFCYYCCSNAVSTQQGGSRERCCRDCYGQHSAVVERHPEEETDSSPSGPFGHLLTQPRKVLSTYTGLGGGPPDPDGGPCKQDDGAFDIITEEEVSGVYETDSLSFSTACSPGTNHQEAAPLSCDSTSEEDGVCGSVVQDAEICLLKAGELTLSVPFTVDDIAAFGSDSRELFVKSSCYSTILISVSSPGATVTWLFTSDPKSISFSVVYRESSEDPLEQAKVLIPLTRCNSHIETIQGELKVRNAGQYALVFDNSFSRFISKKVLYRLSVEKAVVYDGSDCS